MWGSRVLYDIEQQEIHFVYKEADRQTKADPAYQLGTELCRLHLASAGYEIQQDHPLNRSGTWAKRWFQRVKQMEKLRDHLFHVGVTSDFEELFLQDYTYFNQLAQVALFYLEDHQYSHAVQQLQSVSTLAHRSFSWQNVEQAEQGFIFVHPEDWLVDIGVRDLASFIRTSSFTSNSLDESMQFLQGYQNIRELRPEEYHLIYAQLLYPVRWIQLIQKYQVRHQHASLDWEQELQKLHHSYQRWEPVLVDYVEQVYDHFGVEVTSIEWL